MDSILLSEFFISHQDSLTNRSRLQAMLNDVFPAERMDVRLLLTAHELGIMGEICRSELDDALANRLIYRLENEYSINSLKAKEIVLLWCEAYGVGVLNKPNAIQMSLSDVQRAVNESAAVNSRKRELNEIAKGAVKEAKQALFMITDLCKSLFSMMCMDFELSYYLSEQSIETFFQFRRQFECSALSLIKGAMNVCEIDNSEFEFYAEELFGGDDLANIDLESIKPTDLSELRIPWEYKFCFALDETLIKNPKLKYDDFILSQLFLKIAIACTGRVQFDKMENLTSEKAKFIKDYTDFLLSQYSDTTEKVTGVRAEIKMTTVTIHKDEDSGMTTSIEINKDKARN